MSSDLFQFIRFNAFMSIHSFQFILVQFLYFNFFISIISIHSLHVFHASSLISIYSCHSFSSIHWFQFMHCNAFTSSPFCQFLSFNFFVSIHARQFLNVNSFVPIPSLQLTHVNSFVSIHSFQLILMWIHSSVRSSQSMRFNSFMSSHSFQLILVMSFMSWISFHFIHFASFQITMTSCKPWCFTQTLSGLPVSIAPQHFPMQWFPGLLFLSLFTIRSRLSMYLYSNMSRALFPTHLHSSPLWFSIVLIRLVWEWGRNITWFPIFAFKPILKQPYLKLSLGSIMTVRCYLACPKRFILAK